MKYQVKVDYTKFVFDDRDAALDYAEMSREYAVRKPIAIEIELIDEEVEA